MDSDCQSFSNNKTYFDINFDSKDDYLDEFNNSKDVVLSSETEVLNKSSGADLKNQTKSLDNSKKDKRKRSSSYFISSKEIFSSVNSTSHYLDTIEKTLVDHPDEVEDLKSSFDKYSLAENNDVIKINDHNHEYTPLQNDISLHFYNNVNLNKEKKNAARSTVDGLLFEIYDRNYQNSSSSAVCGDSDFTECSTTSVASVFVTSSFENDDRPKLDWSYLETKDIPELEKMIRELKRGSNMLSSKLVRLLKQRDRNAHKIQENFNILTALLQAVSPKRRVDTRIRFSFIPRSGTRGFRQWVDAIKSIARIHPGIPVDWRKRTWLSLAEYFLKDIDWEQIKKQCFNDRCNPDDDQLDSQIVKDLHRTGCGWFFEHDTTEDRASLKRVLLGYARWNKVVGYCQGFNVIAALILQVMNGNEEQALKVMIYVIDYVLPRNYFSNNLHALSVDMAVLRDLMNIKLPELARLLQHLQKEAMNSKLNSSASYEPPLINMFTMQWFLTLFATCLPRHTVLRIWDSVLLEGSEVLLRTALVLWSNLACHFENVNSAPDFYMKMGQLIQDLMSDDFVNVQKLIQSVYQMASFPWKMLVELREKYTYDIHPFTTFNTEKKAEKYNKVKKFVSDEEDSAADDQVPGCLGFVNVQHDHVTNKKSEHLKKSASNGKSDITKVTPGAYITDRESQNTYEEQMKENERIRENEKLDLAALQSQYGRMRRLQQNAMIVFNSDNFKKDTNSLKVSPSAINHLFVDVSKVAPPRIRYSRRSRKQFPALKAPSKGVPSLIPVKDDMVIKDGDEDVIVHVQKTTINSIESKPYEASEIGQLFERGLEKKDYQNDNGSVINSNSFPTSPINLKLDLNSSGNAGFQKLKNTNKKKLLPIVNETDLKSSSGLFNVDRSAIYPPNFNPFPERNCSNKKCLQVK
ncbi:TBC1 domain family member 30 isoform X1 [Hydra vulgaris]|uniref:TBC1 domain family member 30 isoform X1 n=1 Tax=Hydra vulgaris TaxID=6087 RepID=UPI0006417E2F|nr:TBC1 domain family member 30 [Hydra vulgaris]